MAQESIYILAFHVLFYQGILYEIKLYKILLKQQAPDQVEINTLI